MSRDAADRRISRPPWLRRGARRAAGAGRQLSPLSAADRRPASGRADGRAAARGCPAVPAHRRASGRRSACRCRRSFAADEAAGLLLEEDLGDDLFAVLYPSRSRASGAGRRAEARPCSTRRSTRWSAMQRAPPPPDLPLWDAAAMADTALATLFDWWWPAMFGAAGAGRGAAGLRRRARGHARAGRRRTDRLRASGLLRRQSDLAARAHRHPPRRRARLPGRRDRPSRLRSRLAAAGRPPRHPARRRRTRHRALPRRAPGAGPGAVPRRLCRLRGAAPLARRRPMGAPRPARRPTRAISPTARAPGACWSRRVREPAAAPLAAALDRWIPPERRGNPPDIAA